MADGSYLDGGMSVAARYRLTLSVADTALLHAVAQMQRESPAITGAAARPVNCQPREVKGHVMTDQERAVVVYPFVEEVHKLLASQAT